MLCNKTVSVVVPSYNEEKQIRMVIEGIPDFVDRIIVVNDCSTDHTEEIVRACMAENKGPAAEIREHAFEVSPGRYNEAEVVLGRIRDAEVQAYVPSEVVSVKPERERIILINHRINGGVGAAIATGYRWSRDHDIACTAVMAGDGQMDPSELESICRPVVEEGIDYVKGNRLIHRSAPFVVPRVRFLGNSVLSMLTKVASGYWHISDTQCGYTALSLKALQAVPIHRIYRKYGMPNDLLVKLNIAYCTVKEVGIKPVYGVGETSKMNIGSVIPRISGLLLKTFLGRLWTKYFLRDFHPLFLLYSLGFLLGILNIPILIKILRDVAMGKSITFQSLMVFIFFGISSFQSIFFAMWMDIQDNERLYR
jgi:glycosyltransferase involved in cell wall biosynthesis